MLRHHVLIQILRHRFANASHAKAKAAQDAGYLAEEIVPMKVRSVTPADGEKAEVVDERMIEKDEGIRAQTTMQTLAKLKPAFKEDGTSTAGNSSQISDGASAMTLMRRSVAESLGLKPLAKWVGSAVVGVPPKIMGRRYPSSRGEVVCADLTPCHPLFRCRTRVCRACAAAALRRRD